MSKYWKHSNENEDIEEVLDVVVEPEVVESTESSGYIAVRRITYELVNPAIKVAVGADVPMEIINDTKEFKNLLSKGAIVKKED
jgi:hypothetical protein